MLLGLQAMGSEESDYAAAVERVRALVRVAEFGDLPSGQRALVLLQQATGESQPEILADLRKRPPDLRDASARLDALADALRTRPEAPDAARAARELDRILALKRYERLSLEVPWWDRVRDWVLGQVAVLLGRLLSWLVSQLGGGSNFRLPLQLLAIATLLAIAGWLMRAGWRRARGDVLSPRAAGRPAPPPDWFADADHRAEAGDYFGAVRALASGVAAVLGGEGRWERSSLTIREIFSRTEQPERLRPLLLTFEAAAYGHRSPDADAYRRAADAAAPFRLVGR